MDPEAWGKPFQFNRVLDIAPRDWDRMVLAMTGKEYRDPTKGGTTESDRAAKAKPAAKQQQGAAQAQQKPPMFSRKQTDSTQDGTPSNAQAQRQFKETERAYGGRETYDKAKAAGTTKLTYGQWVQVRTPKFKAWFGDWEAVRAQQRLKSMSAVPVQALPAALADGPLREDAKRIYNEAAEKGPITTVDGREVQLTAVGFKKTRFHSADRRVLDLLGSIREVLGNAVPVSSLVHEQENPSDSVRAWHYYGAKVNMNGREWLAKLVVRESVNGQIYYDNDLSSVEEISGRAGDATQNKPGAAAVSADKHTLAELLAAGNPETVSKVVDPQTGEPLVVYHGTYGGGFEVFDKERVGSNIVIPASAPRGFYFAKDRKLAERYGKTVIEAFIAGPVLLNNSKVVVVAEPTQIKSATGNNGNFDPANPDIRFSRSKSQSGLDSEYMRAVEAGDMKTAQRLVNEAAENAGYVGGAD